MRVNTRWLVILALAAAIPLSGCGFITKLRARDALNRGVKAFVEQKYEEAAKLFEESIRLDPEFQVARVYLATTYYSQFVPGSPDPKSKENADKSVATFKSIVASDPGNINAMISIASLYYQMQQYDESKQWCEKIQAVDPNNSESLYRIAVIDYDDSLRKTGLQGESVEFLTAEDREHTLKDIQEGLDVLDKALQLRPDYFDAMEYQNLLWRERAKFEKDAKAKAELIQQADRVALKALAMRLKAQEEEAKRPKKLGVGK
jgi:tetratricopeptide (TPR) repeat protein